MARPQLRHRRRRGADLDTRQALLEAALELVDKDHSFDALSLRKVTQEVGVVPTAFYRHFPDMESLGLALVEQSFGTMRRLLRAAREGAPATDQAVRSSVEAFMTYVRAHRRHFLFVSRERLGGNATIRMAINNEIDAIVDELGEDLGRFPVLKDWNPDDRSMLANLLVGAMIRVIEKLLLSRQRNQDQAELVTMATRQLMLVLVGVPGWRSQPKS